MFYLRMGLADRSHHYWAARKGRGISIDDRVDALRDGTVYADKQLVVMRVPDPIGLRFSGEIDINNCGAVARCLSEIPAQGVGVHLDVSGLIFCDACHCRSLTNWPANASNRMQTLKCPCPEKTPKLSLKCLLIEKSAGR